MTFQVQHPDWTFFSNHFHVLHCIFVWPDIRIRDIATKVLITERAVQRIVVDLERGGYLRRERVGRQNRYLLEPEVRLRHPLEHHLEIGRLLSMLQPPVGEKSFRNARHSNAVTARRRKGVSSLVAANLISRFKKRPRKPRKPSATTSD